MKDEIESLTRKGKLEKYRCYGDWREQEKGKGRAHSRSPQQKDANRSTNMGEHKILGTIKTISGGFTREGISNHA